MKLVPASIRLVGAIVPIAVLITGCAHTTNSESSDTNYVSVWIERSALPSTLAWHRRIDGRAAVIVRHEHEMQFAGHSSLLAQEVAENLASLLEVAGVTAAAGAEGEALMWHESSCTASGPRPLTLVVTADASGDALSKGSLRLSIRGMRSESERPEVISSVKLPLTPALAERAKRRADKDLRLGTQLRPFNQEETDQLLATLAGRLRCDLLRAGWRSTSAIVDWDVAEPSGWYRSLGMRLRDELLRREVVNGGPGSALSLGHLGLRLETLDTRGVYRLVARATPANADSNQVPAIWQQVYFETPGPASAPSAKDREDVTSSDTAVAGDWDTGNQVPLVTNRTIEDLGRAARLETIRLLRPAGAIRCDADDPWHQGAVIAPTSTDLMTGACIALEIIGAAGREVFVLHENNRGVLSRLLPSRCLGSQTVDNSPISFNVPKTQRRGHAIRLSPPDGTERFHAITLGAKAPPQLTDALRSVPEACMTRHDGLQTHWTAIGSRLDDAVPDGRAAWQFIDVTHRQW